MATLSKGYSFGATETVTAAKLSALVDSASISGIVAADISNNAVTNDKIYSVTGSKITSLTDIPSGAGVIPTANLPSDNDVKLTGDQTVAGIKTFSSSPIVPTPTTDMQASTKKFVDDHTWDASDIVSGTISAARLPSTIPNWVAGSTVISTLNTTTTTTASWTKLKHFTVGTVGGTFRVSFTADWKSVGTDAYARIYKNGVAFGTQRSGQAPAVTAYTEDLAFAAGDTIEIWGITGANYNTDITTFTVAVEMYYPVGAIP